MVDSTKRYSDDEKNVFLHSEKKIFYISSEIPNPYRRLTGQSSAEIADIDFYEKIKHLETVRLFLCRAGWITHCSLRLPEIKQLFTGKWERCKKRIGFAGTIDNRIYFSMVQCICETFPDYDVVFAGHIYRSYPIWLDGFANLHYIEASYQELPQIIQSFEVAILPFLDGISRRFQQSCFSIWLWENRWLHRTCQTFQGLRAYTEVTLLPM